MMNVVWKKSEGVLTLVRVNDQTENFKEVFGVNVVRMTTDELMIDSKVIDHKKVSATFLINKRLKQFDDHIHLSDDQKLQNIHFVINDAETLTVDVYKYKEYIDELAIELHNSFAVSYGTTTPTILFTPIFLDENSQTYRSHNKNQEIVEHIIQNEMFFDWYADTTTTEKLILDRNEFWNIIETSRQIRHQTDRNKFIVDHLAKLTDGEIEQFGEHLDTLIQQLHSGDQMNDEIYFNLLSSGYAVSEEGYHQFCSWLVSKGKKAYEYVLETPSFLPVLVSDECPSNEELLNVVHDALKLHYELKGRL